MMFLSIIEYIFFYTRARYQKWGENDIAGVYAICLISLIQFFNIFTFYLIALLLKVLDINQIEGLYFVALFLIILLLNYLYIYKIRGVNKIAVNFQDNRRNNVIQKRGFYYIIFSAISFLIAFICRLKDISHR
jgi:hypothetical protein